MRTWLWNRIAELGTAAVCSYIGFWAVGSLYDLLLEFGMNWYFAGDKSNGFAGIFVGCPGGALVGVVFVDRWIQKTHSWNMMGVVCGLLMSYAAGVVGIYAIDHLRLGSIMLVGFPLIVSFGVCIGYRVGALFKQMT